MRKLILSVLLLFVAISPAPTLAEDLVLHQAWTSVYFSPSGGAQAAIIREIDKARESVRVMSYSFTSAPIAEALLNAHKRGVKVEAVLDKSQKTANYSGATFLRNAGIPVWIDHAHAIMHNKVMILDESVVITGSFNFTRSAEERNAENLLVIRDRGLARAYLVDWEKHRGHAAP
jgi:phosphatidylserine/phosphatidylglycerophosphate/cardiolipin synthase-like enzyme